MAIAGAVIVPVSQEAANGLKERMESLKGVEVQDIGDKGIAVVLEAEDTKELERISEEIRKWDNVLDVQLAYLNWEEVVNRGTGEQGKRVKGNVIR